MMATDPEDVGDKLDVAALLEGTTPGPWVQTGIEPDRTYVRVRGTRWGELFKIANVLFPSDCDEDEAKANARAIAALPDIARAYLAQSSELTEAQREIEELRDDRERLRGEVAGFKRKWADHFRAEAARTGSGWYNRGIRDALNMAADDLLGGARLAMVDAALAHKAPGQ